MATLANLLLIRALTKASTLPTNVKRMLNCKNEENLGEAKGKRDDTVFSPLPLPFFPYFALATTHGLLFLLSPIFICRKKKTKMANNSLLTKDTLPIAWACALEADRRMPGKEVVAYNCMHECLSPFKIGSLPSAWPWEIWVRDKTRPTTYDVRLQRKLES